MAIFKRAAAVCVVMAMWRTSAAADVFVNKTLTRLAFASCSKHDRVQPLWMPLIEYHPELFVWLGDIVYADTRIRSLHWVPTPVEGMKAKWMFQKQREDYRAFLASGVEVVGVWDDHDYGVNDGGGEYANKSNSKEFLLDFLDDPPDSVRRGRDGVYISYAYGEGDRRTLLILLDERWFRVEPSEDGTVPDELLGEEQWSWLEEQLKDPAPLKLIGSGIQMFATTPIVDSFRRFPRSYKRLIDLIHSTKAQGVVVLSGDVHYAEINCCSLPECRPIGYPLYDFTSSGMTHTCPMGVTGWLCSLALTWLPRSTTAVKKVYGDFNVGGVDIDWLAGTVRYVVIGPRGPTSLHITVNFTELREGPLDDVNGCPANEMYHRSKWRTHLLLTVAVVLHMLGTLCLLLCLSVMARRLLIGRQRPPAPPYVASRTTKAD